MKSWDSLTAEFDENSMDYKSAFRILSDSVLRDNEFRFYILRVNNLYTEDKLKKMNISKREFLAILKNTLNRKKESYFSSKLSIFRDPLNDKVPHDYHKLSEINKFNYHDYKRGPKYRRDWDRRK